MNRIALQQLSEMEKKESQKKKAAEALKMEGEHPAEEILRRGLVEVMRRKPTNKPDNKLDTVDFAAMIKIDVAAGSAATLKESVNSSSKQHKLGNPRRRAGAQFRTGWQRIWQASTQSRNRRQVRRLSQRQNNRLQLETKVSRKEPKVAARAEAKASIKRASTQRGLVLVETREGPHCERLINSMC